MLHGPRRLSAPLSAPPYVLSIGPPLLSHCHRHRCAAALQQSPATPRGNRQQPSAPPEPKTRGDGASGLAGPQWCGTAGPSSGTTDTQPAHATGTRPSQVELWSGISSQPGSLVSDLGGGGGPGASGWAGCHSLVMALITRTCTGSRTLSSHMPALTPTTTTTTTTTGLARFPFRPFASRPTNNSLSHPSAHPPIHPSILYFALGLWSLSNCTGLISPHLLQAVGPDG